MVTGVDEGGVTVEEVVLCFEIVDDETKEEVVACEYAGTEDTTEEEVVACVYAGTEEDVVT